MITEFFMPMIPPTTTHQEKRITYRNGKPVVYEEADLKNARAKLTADLSKHIPKEKYTGAIRLIVKWCFPIKGKHADGDYKTSKPDTDNLQKLLKDIMTELGFWSDDALVCVELSEKFWASIPGIYINIKELPVNGHFKTEA